jgi:single-stranded-DNA-specific exonuclease
MVAWLLMAEVRSRLIELGRLPQNAPSLASLLDFVAVGTVADCVSLADSVNNRAVVRYGLQQIQKAARPCWRAIQPLLRGPVSSEDLGFVIGPLLNSDGRLSDALTSVSFLLAKTDEEANDWVKFLSEQNEERKKIQNTITQEAYKQALIQVEQGFYSICLFLEEGHAGIHGISASRVKDAFGRPTVIFSPKKNHPELITGSARSIDGFHIRQVLETVAKRMPEGIVAFGGHKGAAGVTLKKETFSVFVRLFEEATRAFLGSQKMGPVIWTDGSLPTHYFTVAFAKQIETFLQPFGRAFEPPTFDAIGVVLKIQPVGNRLHLRVQLRVDAQLIDAIWFNARLDPEDSLPISLGEEVHFAYRLRLNDFRGVISLSPQIVGCSPVGCSL